MGRNFADRQFVHFIESLHVVRLPCNEFKQTINDLWPIPMKNSVHEVNIRWLCIQFLFPMDKINVQQLLGKYFPEQIHNKREMIEKRLQEVWEGSDRIFDDDNHKLINDMIMCGQQKSVFDTVNGFFLSSSACWLEVTERANFLQIVTKEKLQLVGCDFYNGCAVKMSIILDAVEKMPCTTDRLWVSFWDVQLASFEERLSRIIINKVNLKLILLITGDDEKKKKLCKGIQEACNAKNVEFMLLLKL